MDSSIEYELFDSSWEIVACANELIAMFLAQTALMPFLFDPRPETFVRIRETLFGDSCASDFPIYVNGETPEEELVFSGTVVLERARSTLSNALREDAMSAAMMLGVTRLADLVYKRECHDSQSELLEFMRHFRNACAHGNRWNFAKNEPRLPAGTEKLQISRDLQGERAAWGTVTPYIYLHFLIEMLTHFANIALRESWRRQKKVWAQASFEQFENGFLTVGYLNSNGALSGTLLKKVFHRINKETGVFSEFTTAELIESWQGGEE
ncbi:hypothetical protein JTE88_02460 [Arcanobacterium phocisimile]|uniref:Abi-like protein n=1 Tax=Arcanobacterium phocisimile TaxID=1302235 RepID=A0ABX7II16_9ACTO|nr:hypothetical protein [Arcanobacterium phocisimile]QRV02626.1 hypothetical protein JTE88_02460 [Arcanobacterium phocisimile]